jgi:hypothetical protein
MNDLVQAFGPFIFAAMLFLGLCCVLLLPIFMVAWSIGPRLPHRSLIHLIWSYTLGAGILGFVVYLTIPAQYTKYRAFDDFSTHSDSLGAIHSDWLQRVRFPEAVSPKTAEVVLNEVAAERLQFAREWGMVWVAGLVLLVLTWAVIRGAPTPNRSF